MAKNAIASASVVLSANADGLTAGLDKAQRQVQGFADGVSGAGGGKGGGKGGGIVSGLLFGGGIGAGLALATEAFDLIGAAVDKLADPAARVNLGLDGEQAAKVDGMLAAFDELGETLNRAFGDIASAVAPAFETGAKIVEDFVEFVTPAFERIAKFASGFVDYISQGFANLYGPAWDAVANALGGAGDLFDRIGEGLEAVKFVAIEMYAEVGALVGDLVTGIAEVGSGIVSSFGVGVEYLTGFKLQGIDATDAVFAGLEMVGKAAGYVWDALKVGAGVMARVGAEIVDILAMIVDTFRVAIKGVIETGAEVADALGMNSLSSQLDKAASDINGLADRIGGTADAMREWGKGTLDNFGASAAQIETWFDRIRAKFDATRKAFEKAQDEQVVLKNPAAALRDSTDAYSVVARFQTDAMSGEANAAGDRDRDEARQQTRLLARIEKAILGNAAGVI